MGAGDGLTFPSTDLRHMRRAIWLAQQGQGFVEPNPLVGCVIARDEQILGEGWHHHYGGPHAEVEAIRAANGQVRGATLYVTLEPCCHHGKTPPCTRQIIDAGITRVVVAIRDPFPEVDGGGLRELHQAGIQVEVGALSDEATKLNAPYLKLVQTGHPWVIAKWAMTLDGKLATHSGHSRWISSELSRAKVHQLRGRVDAILVGSGTAIADDPRLTARPPGPRTAMRVVIDSAARLPLHSLLAQTARQIPVLLVASQQTPSDRCEQLAALGVEVLVADGDTHLSRLKWLLDELGRRKVTNLLVEGGARTFANLQALGEIDEVHAFIAPRMIGGVDAPSPIAGAGIDSIDLAWSLIDPVIERCGDDAYIHGRVRMPDSAAGGR